MNINIIEEEDGFYFIDEIEYIIGPFKNYNQAEIALNAHIKWLEKDNQKELPKIKDRDYNSTVE